MRKVLLATTLVLLTPLTFLCALIVALTSYSHHAQTGVLGAQTSASYAAIPSTQNIFSGDVQAADGRTEKVRQFLAKYNSPLEPYAQDIIDAADEYNLDYRLIPAIAMTESTLCKKIPEGSNNCWGFGIYGKTVTTFKDYHEAIFTVSKALGTRYRKNGLVTPEEIMTMYTPSSDGHWAFSVRLVMSSLQ